MKTIKSILYLTIVASALLGCGAEQEEIQQETGFIEITKRQFETDSMQLGKAEKRLFENIVTCSGTIVPQPKGIAKVNAPLSGIVKGISRYNGNLVDQNEQLLEVGGNEIIDIQNEFAEASASYRRLKSDYERVTSLYNEKVTAEKEYILAETEYKASMAKYSALKLKVEAIGLSPSKIENGEFYPSYHIKSPIKGYISSLKTSIGSYISPQDELLEIINPELLQVKLLVFASDVELLRKGQTVRLKLDSSTSIQLATIISIGVAVDMETKTVESYAKIDNLRTAPLLANEYVNCEVVTSADSVSAAPSDAIIKTEDGAYVLMLSKQDDEKLYFTKQSVAVGREQNGYAEIKSPINGTMLTRGVYNISNID